MDGFGLDWLRFGLRGVGIGDVGGEKCVVGVMKE